MQTNKSSRSPRAGLFWLYLLLILLSYQGLSAQQASTPQFYVFNKERINELLGDFVYYRLDAPTDKLPEQILEDNNFIKNEKAALSVAYQGKPVWLSFAVQNHSNFNTLVLEVMNAQVDTIELYQVRGKTAELIAVQGDWVHTEKGKELHVFPRFHLSFPKDSIRQFLMRVSSRENITLPIRIGTPDSISASSFRQHLIFGTYIGAIIVMFLYNLFLYVTIRDKSYLYYILYIFFIGLAQAAVGGYLRILLWPESEELHQFSIVFFSSLAGFGAISFAKAFLNLKINAPKINQGLNIFYMAYAGAVISYLSGQPRIAYGFLDMGGLSVALYALFFSIRLTLQGLRSAKFFLAAWIFFIIGLVVYVCRTLGFLPFNLLTDNAMQIGSAAEAVMMSIALADRINTLKEEKEKSQAEALIISRENERIIREQNVLLETKVNERTGELQRANTDLSGALNELKEAQTQLVEAEKMASLGQLTAGVAHEINNPINFVSSNIRPLRRDMEDMVRIIEEYDRLAAEDVRKQMDQFKSDVEYDYIKEEVEMLLKGIEEGATRTVEIVKSLRNFSRLDEQDLKKAQVHEGLDSTLILLNSSMGGFIEIEKRYENLPEIECYPGKLNQVFMNLFSNSIYAIKRKHESRPTGKLRLETINQENDVVIRIWDNGSGIQEEVRNKIFEPFYTTKPVGEGTGLGLSIVYKIIESHRGTIRVDSEEGEWTQFTITLPKFADGSDNKAS